MIHKIVENLTKYQLSKLCICAASAARPVDFRYSIAVDYLTPALSKTIIITNSFKVKQ